MGKPRTRGNHTGSVYKRTDRNTWTAQIVVGWKQSSAGKMIPIKKRFGGFKTKKEALATLDRMLNGESIEYDNVTFEDTFNLWKEVYQSRVKWDTFRGYIRGFKYFGDLRYRKINTITASDLQLCIDKCAAGKRTHKLMKSTAKLIWAYAFDMNIVKKDVTQNLYIGKYKATKRNPLTPEDIELIKNAIGKLRYAEYIYCLCYLGYRPGEFLEIKKEQVHYEIIDGEMVYYIIEGIKTEAGIDRIVVIPKQILPFILERLWIPGTEYLFPMYCYRHPHDQLIGFKKMRTNYFGDHVFKPIMNELNIVGKVPYSARHTYADKLKHADGDDKDKAALIGHTDMDFTRKQYQSSPLEDLKKVTDSIK